MDKRTCSVEGCAKDAAARGWCMTHYVRWRKHGDPTVRLTAQRPKTCTIPGCDRPHKGLGWCDKHYSQLKPGKPCSIEGCDRRQEGHGLCQTHRKQAIAAGTITPKKIAFHTSCTVEGCELPHTSNGLCAKHQTRMNTHGTTDAPRQPTTYERLMSKVDKNGPIPAHAPELGPCWIWTGGLSASGYGSFWAGAELRVQLPHRWMYDHVYGIEDATNVIDHKCFRRNCVNPSHLREITFKQNIENQSALVNASNTSGFRGVSYNKRNRSWSARVIHNREIHWLGYFSTAEEAGRAAQAMRNKLFTHNDLERAM